MAYKPSEGVDWLGRTQKGGEVQWVGAGSPEMGYCRQGRTQGNDGVAGWLVGSEVTGLVLMPGSGPKELH